MMRWFGDIQGWLYGGATAQLKGVAAGVDPFKLLAAMTIAAVLGMVHALMPGHGKTVIVSYYLGHPARLVGSIATSAAIISRFIMLCSYPGVIALCREARAHLGGGFAGLLL